DRGTRAPWVASPADAGRRAVTAQSCPHQRVRASAHRRRAAVTCGSRRPARWSREAASARVRTIRQANRLGVVDGMLDGRDLDALNGPGRAVLFAWRLAVGLSLFAAPRVRFPIGHASAAVEPNATIG